MTGDARDAPKVFSWMGSGGVTADSSLVFFADESGNTFANHMDLEQPFYVTGGWLLREADVPLAEAITAGVLASTDLRELKGARMMKTTRGQRAAHALVPRLLAFSTPLLVVIEKRFALGGRIFDDFIMYPGGPYFPTHPDRALGRSVATIFARLPEQTLAIANEYLANRSPQRAAVCAPAIAEALRAAGQHDLAMIVLGSHAAPAAWWASSKIATRSVSPNVTGYTTLLQMLEILALEARQKVALVHDEVLQLTEVYEFYQDYAARANLTQTAEFFEKIGCPGRVAHVSRPRFAKSHSEPLVQAADVLCSVATSFLASPAAVSRPATSESNDLALLALWGFVEPELRAYFKFIGLHESGMRFGQRLVDLMPVGAYEGAD